ncbi:MAG TPA: hypothetical protein VN437_01645, partial [Rectinemataceae bacterium]|nr:hypothetical protein [Rectinemataceae bacterium]
MNRVHARKGQPIGAASFFIASFAFLVLPLATTRAQDLSAPLDESALFGGGSDLVTTIDTQTAAAGTIELVKDTKTYPVFLVEGSAGGGIYGSLVPYGATASDHQSVFGAVSLSGLTVDFLPSKDLHFNASLDGIFIPGDAKNVTATAYADLRASEFTRLYAAGTYTYNPTVSYDPLGTSQDTSLTLDELFLDTSLARKVFFRIGKQRVSWGVGNWFKPADVLSLAAINPDDPTAAREGPYALKVDAPFGKLNQATLYMVPSLLLDQPEAFSVAGKADVVVGNFELNFGAFGRADMEAKPRAMFMFTGAVGPFDVYGENVLAYGSDRTYVNSDGLGGYTLSTVDNVPVFQSTLGIKYSYSNSNGLSLAFHVQGYYNGAGYQDSSILQIAAARKAIKDNSAYKTTDLLQAGMYYLAGSASIGGRWGEGLKLTQWTLSAYGIGNFSDMSFRGKPSFVLSIGDQGSRLDMTLSALATFGEALSE